MIVLQRLMVKLLTLADIISLLNVLFGFFSIMILLYTSFIHLSFTFLLLAVLADGFDGMIARKRKKSSIGENLDSLADIISMGVAPLLFIYNLYKNIEVFQILLVISFLFYLSTSTIRLASFSIFKRNDSFIGLPIPSASLLVITAAYLQIPVIIVIFFLFLSGLLMISDMVFIKLDIKIDLISLIVIVLAILLGWHPSRIPIMVLFILDFLYILSSPLFLLKKSHGK